MQKQNNGDIKLIACGSRYLNDSEKNNSIGAIKTLLNRNRGNLQSNAKLTRWLDQFSQFDIAVQQVAGSNLEHINFLSRIPVNGVVSEAKYDEEYVINISTEHAELDKEYGSLFDNQSKCTKEEPIRI